jgi:hypothetical protein
MASHRERQPPAASPAVSWCGFSSKNFNRYCVAVVQEARGFQSEGLLSQFGFNQDLIELGTMARKLSMRIGLGALDLAEPFFASTRLGWTWTPVNSARTCTSEEDMLSELLGRVQADAVVTEPPWVRVDVEMHATLPHGEPLRTEGARCATSVDARSYPRGRTDSEVESRAQHPACRGQRELDLRIEVRKEADR